MGQHQRVEAGVHSSAVLVGSTPDQAPDHHLVGNIEHTLPPATS